MFRPGAMCRIILPHHRKHQVAHWNKAEAGRGSKVFTFGLLESGSAPRHQLAS